MRQQNGFTLVELIIAIVLMSMMSLILLSSFNQGINTWDAIEKQTKKMAEQRLVWRFMNQSIKEMKPITTMVDFKRRSLFSGSEDRIEFVSPVAKKAGIGGLSIIRIGLVKVDNQQDLVINRWLYHPEVIQGKVTERRWQRLAENNELHYSDGVKGSEYGEHLLAENIDELQFEYLSKQEKKWELEWDKKTLPLLVKVKIKKEGQAWQDFIFNITGNAPSKSSFAGGGFHFGE